MGLTNGGRSRSFDALRDSEELHRTVLSNISDAVFLTTDDGHFTFICPNVDIIFGYVPDEVQAMTRISHLLGDNLFDPARFARSELAHASRLTVVGELVASIVQEVRQPHRRLGERRDRTSSARRQRSAPSTASLREILTDVSNQSQLASDVIERLRSLVRKQAFKLETIDVNDLVADMQRLAGG